MGTTSIEWTRGADGSKGQTWNPVSGCIWNDAACDHCYAASMTRRLEAMGQADYTGLTTAKHFNGVVRLLEHRLDVPLRRKKPTRWFVNSMSDLFHKSVPFGFVDKVFAVMALCPQHTFQILTKRPERMAEYFVDDLRSFKIDYIANVNWDKRHGEGACMSLPQWKYPLPNVWLGCSVGNQAAADKSRDHFRKVIAAVKFVSYEPAIGPVDWGGWEFVDQIISGGESGPNGRPSNPQWHRNTRDYCTSRGIAYFFKQWGSWALCTRENGFQGHVMPNTPKRFCWVDMQGNTACPSAKELTADPVYAMGRTNKKRAGRLLDGREWNEMPEVARA